MEEKSKNQRQYQAGPKMLSQDQPLERKKTKMIWLNNESLGIPGQNKTREENRVELVQSIK